MDTSPPLVVVTLLGENTGVTVEDVAGEYALSMKRARSVVLPTCVLPIIITRASGSFRGEDILNYKKVSKLFFPQFYFKKKIVLKTGFKKFELQKNCEY